uniref:Solute carrier family 40 protein n=1 Tax=Heterorhabditis bacteriophora TaxID=37862 RepID=A0A1I7WM31_HETBA
MSLEETLSLTPFVKSLDDFLRLSWYSLIILWLAEFLALSCLASMTFMMYADNMYNLPTFLPLFWTVVVLAYAKEILEKISKIDGNNDDDFSLDLENWFLRERQVHILLAERTSKKRHYTFIHLFCTWKMMSWTITLVTGITTAALVTYALLYNMEKLSGSIFWNSAIFGIVRWIMNIIVALGDYYVPWFGRRAINQAAMLFNIFALGCMAFLYWKGKGSITLRLIAVSLLLLLFEELPINITILNSIQVGGWMLRTGTILAMSMCSQLFLAKYILANELYPTAVRNLAISAMSTSSRLGTIFAPQLFYLGDIALYLPYFVLLCLSMFDFIVFQCYIPETKGKRLENHLPPKEQRLFYKKKAESNPLVKA